MAEVSVIRKLVLSLLFFMIVAGVILGTGLGDWVMDAVNFIMNLLLGDLGDDQVAKDSVQALTCAIDVAALAGPDGTAGAIGNGPASCWEGNDVGMAIATYAPRHGPITARVIDGANRITGAAIPKNQCGPVDECGVLAKKHCDEGYRCIKGLLGSWVCVSDPTCTSAGERAKAAEGAYVRCFGQDDHVCIVCEDPPPEKTVCCARGGGLGTIRYKWVPESECDGSTLLPDDYCYETVGSKGHKFTCTIIGFELPQKVDIGSGIFTDATEFAAAWIGAVGEPRYLVYYETFPEGIENAWIYEEKDAILSAVAVAGVMNIGFGPLKAGWAGMRAAKGGFCVVRKAGIKMALKNALTKGKGAAYERLVLEYGGERAVARLRPEMLYKKKLASAALGMDNTFTSVDASLAKGIVNDISLNSRITAIFGKNYDALLPGVGRKSAVNDLALLVRSGNKIEKNTVRKILKRHKVTTDKLGNTIPEEGFDDLADELSEAQRLYKEGDFFSDHIMKAIANAPPSDDAYMAVFSKKGVIASMNKLKAKGAIRKEAYKEWNSKAEKLAPSLEDDFKRRADTLHGMADDISTPRGKFVADYGEVLTNIEKNPDFSPVSMDTLKTRVATLTQGLTVGHGGWTLETRRKLMIAAFVGSYLAMRTDAHLEKYGTCGGGKMCLHFPAVFGNDNNEPYQQDAHLTQNYAGLVMSVLPSFTGGKTDRFHIMSPCKADLVVEAHKADGGFCKCDVFYKHDSNEIVYKMQKVRCVSDKIIMKITVPINADGTCPETYKRTGADKIKMKSDELKKTHEGQNTFSCDISGVAYDDVNEALEKCKYEFMHKDGCVDNPDTDYDDCLIDLYRDCYFDPDEMVPIYPGTDTEGNYFCENDQSGVKNCNDEGCIGMDNSPYYTVPFSRHQDTFAIPVNAKENVNTGVIEPVTVCTNSWSSDFLDKFKDEQHRDYPCIAVRYDVDSMRGYSEAGFGENYCAENHAQFADALEGTCFWGGMAGAVVVSAFSGGGTAAVIIPVAIGSAGMLCEKITQMKTKWPQNQY